MCLQLQQYFPGSFPRELVDLVIMMLMTIMLLKFAKEVATEHKLKLWNVTFVGFCT